MPGGSLVQIVQLILLEVVAGAPAVLVQMLLLRLEEMAVLEFLPQLLVGLLFSMQAVAAVQAIVGQLELAEVAATVVVVQAGIMAVQFLGLQTPAAAVGPTDIIQEVLLMVDRA
jgi:hypothetical protein